MAGHGQTRLLAHGRVGWEVLRQRAPLTVHCGHREGRVDDRAEVGCRTMIENMIFGREVRLPLGLSYFVATTSSVSAS